MRGRKPVRPGGMDEAGIGLYADGVRKIMRKCGIPKSWGDKEAWLLFAAAIAPMVKPAVMDPLTIDKQSGKMDLADETRVMLGLYFAHLYAQKPVQVTAALDLIRKMFVARSKSPEFTTAEYCAKNGFNTTAAEIATRLSTSTEVVQKARKRLRRAKPFSPN
jgi:hypothetical protein